MEIYNTSVDRLSCTSNRTTNIADGLPESIEEIENAPAIQLNELLEMPLECQFLQAMTWHTHTGYNGGFGYASNLPGTPLSPVTNIVLPATSNEAGEVYSLNGDEYNYREGIFSNSYGFSLNELSFKRVGNTIIKTSYDRSSGGSVDGPIYSYALSRCQAQ